MNSRQEEFDVIVVGYGPTGLVLASLLGQQGHRVAVVERWPQLYGKPRLTHIDGETARLISLCADGEMALRDSWTTPHYYWRNGKGQLLMDVAAGNTKKMLWDDHLSVHQPHIEEAIHERIEALPNVRLFRGFLATALEQGPNGVTLRCKAWTKGQNANASDATELNLVAHYLVGADGANSFVREAAGIDRHDFGFNERWLCVDTEPLRPLPAKFDECAVQICDPRRGYMFMPIGKKRQRFEFALLPSESTEQMSTPETAYALLAQYHGIARDDVRLIRHLVYTFECRLAKVWKVGRVFLAGDAAHTNPPYLGQGACSGMRDGANLAWKLNLVLRGKADAALLETYEEERRPHAQKLMLDSRSLGLVANTANPVKAAVRDLLFKLKLTPKPQFPILTAGVLLRGGNGKPDGAAGTLPPQGRLMAGGRHMRFDEHVGFRFSLVARAGAVDALSEKTRETLAVLDVRVIELADGAQSGGQRILDVDGIYQRCLDDLGADLILIRPDFVLFGSAMATEVDDLVGALQEQLSRVVSQPALVAQLP
jgi:3-(3-hydroxy-phenyl)propionate hydroxylase